MPQYKHLFFDLDRTLWDFDKNATENFKYIYTKYHLEEKGIPALQAFRANYERHNNLLWSFYRRGKIKKEVLSVKRFALTLADFGIETDGIAVRIAEDYLVVHPDRIYLFPHAKETIQYLANKGYHLHLITNGFEEVQLPKIRLSGLQEFFEKIITSEEAGTKKPEKEIFYFALEKTGADLDESIMIGDDLKVDIIGAKNIGMDQVYFNHLKKPHKEKITFEVNDLKELTSIF